MELIDSILQYIPTAIATLVLGFAGNKVLRANKKDDNALAVAANRLKETQMVLDAQDTRINQLQEDLNREREWRKESDDRARRLQDIVVGQIEMSATSMIEPIAIQQLPPRSLETENDSQEN